MKVCNVIVIDDKIGYTSSATMKNFINRAYENNQLQINLIHLNPKLEKYVDENGSIIIEKVITELKTNDYLNQMIHLIICDYDLGDDALNGFEIIRTLRKDIRTKKRVILYSSNIDNVIDKIVKGNTDEITAKIIDLVKSNISDFCKRDAHLEESIIKSLNEESDFSTDKFFEAELYKYGEYPFQSTYDKFENKKLSEIAKIISDDPNEGARLKKELIEQIIAHMIHKENG